MTTTSEIMPTLAEIEAGLRARCTELEQVRNTEAEQRDKMRRIITRTAHQQGNDNSIGEPLDDLLMELGLPARPLKVNVYLQAVHRQPIASPHNIRDLRNPPWAAYQNLVAATVETTTEMALQVDFPREQATGCACEVDVTDEQVDAILGRIATGVERVSLTRTRCAMSEYPYSVERDQPNRCVNKRATHQAERDAAHDDPLVQSCTTYPHPTYRHWHVWYLNGESAYTTDPAHTPLSGGTVLPGVYARGTDVIGQPAVEPEPEPDLTRVQQCTVLTHPARAVHVHVQFPNLDLDGSPSYSRDLNYGVEGDEVLLPGRFSRSEDRVGSVIEQEVDVSRVQECELSLHPDYGYHLHFRSPHGSGITYSDDLYYTSVESIRVDGVFTRERDLIGGPSPI